MRREKRLQRRRHLHAARARRKVVEGIGIPDIDREGRYLRVDFGNLSVISLYQPSGSSGEERQRVKFSFMKRFFPHLKRLRAEGREIVLCGDWNIAHKEIDLKNWRGNRKNSGFLPEEREWLTRVFDELGWVDAFRCVDCRPEQYTWWSNRGQAWAKNVGWRIDYQIATPALAAAAKRCSIYKDQRFSDHAPLTIDYDYSLRRTAGAPPHRSSAAAPAMTRRARGSSHSRAAHVGRDVRRDIQRPHAGGAADGIRLGLPLLLTGLGAAGVAQGRRHRPESDRPFRARRPALHAQVPVVAALRPLCAAAARPPARLAHRHPDRARRGALGLSFAQPSPERLLPISLAALLVAFFSASQDIVVDAYRRETLAEAELGLGSALYVNGYRVGMLLAGGGGLILADWSSFQTMYRLMAAVSCSAPIAVTLLAPEPPLPEGRPRTLTDAVILPFRDYFTREGAWLALAFILLYKLGDTMASAMTTPFYLDLGYSKTEIGAVVKLFGFWATIAGGTLGGIWILRIGHEPRAVGLRLRPDDLDARLRRARRPAADRRGARDGRRGGELHRGARHRGVRRLHGGAHRQALHRDSVRAALEPDGRAARARLRADRLARGLARLGGILRALHADRDPGAGAAEVDYAAVKSDRRTVTGAGNA